MVWLAYALLGGSVFVLSYEFFKFGAKTKGDIKQPVISSSLILKLTLPVIRAFLLPSVKNLKIDDYRKKMKLKIQSAGMQESLSPDELFSLKILLTGGLPLIACIYNFGLNVANPLILILIFGSIGFVFPDLWIKNMIQDRQQKIRLAIPFVVDLLALCTEAGLDFMQAMQRVVQKAKRSPLIEELDQVLIDLRLGSTRGEALRNLSQRIQMTEISSLVAVLVTADQMGGSISNALKAQSDQIRNERFIKAEKAGAAASQKILFPLIFFIVPAVFIVVLGPIVAKLLQAIFSGEFGGVGGGLLG